MIRLQYIEKDTKKYSCKVTCRNVATPRVDLFYCVCVLLTSSDDNPVARSTSYAWPDTADSVNVGRNENFSETSRYALELVIAKSIR